MNRFRAGLQPSGFSTLLQFVCVSLVALLITTIAASSQEIRPSTCLAMAQNHQRFLVHPASLDSAMQRHIWQTQSTRDPYEVNIRYITHSTFRIRSPKGVIIATDYSGRAGSGDLPDIVTMNHAHITHFTLLPEPEIKHVLKGWGSDGKPADHYLPFEDTLVRNVPTDIYRNGVLIEIDGNSIFIFEIAGLCIGHVGHLHHSLTPQHIAAIGRLDVLMVPVDGAVTISIQGMAEVARQLRASVILPMHWFSEFALARFIEIMSANFNVDVTGKTAIDLSLNTLPKAPTVMILQPETGSQFRFGDP